MNTTVEALLHRDQFPRASKYSADWLTDNMMGPNVLSLAEWLSQAMSLTAGMRVLDLGCGRALSSIFFAKEFGVRVWAADLWIGPNQNWQRVVQAEVQDLVCPIRAEAHALPFAEGFFDAIVSIDAYHYFGTDELYLSYLRRFVRPGGTIGMVVPGLVHPVDDGVPAHLSQPQSNGKVFWEDECYAFRTVEWWKQTWTRSGKVQVEVADLMPDGWRLWADSEKAIELLNKGAFPSDVEALERDAGRTMAIMRVVAKTTQADTENLYDPTLGLKVGMDK